MENLDPVRIFMVLFALMIAIPIHEFAHAVSAVSNGDDGPRRDGRFSIMPWDHFEPVGAIFCVFSSIFGIGLGWGKPVLVNPGVLKNPRWSMCRIAAWGPLSNLLLAIGFALPIRFGVFDLTVAQNQPLVTLLLTCVAVNLSLMLFNLIPIGPLDGAKVLLAFLPDKPAYEFSRFMQHYGMLLLFGLITVGHKILETLVGVPMFTLLYLLIGTRGR